MKTVSIGFYREDGDFAILATLNNNDDLIGLDLFENTKNILCEILTGETGFLVEGIERQDAPDYAILD
jgi:hypothetical protein